MQKGGRKALIAGTEVNNKWKTSNSWIIQIIGIYFLVLKQTRFFSNQKVFIWCLFSYVPVGGTKQHAMHEMICFTLIDWPWTKSFITNWGLSLIGLGNDRLSFLWSLLSPRWHIGSSICRCLQCYLHSYASNSNYNTFSNRLRS